MRRKGPKHRPLCPVKKESVVVQPLLFMCTYFCMSTHAIDTMQDPSYTNVPAAKPSYWHLLFPQKLLREQRDPIVQRCKLGGY